MTFSFPRVSVTIDDDKGKSTRFDVNSLSIGLGLNQTWIYASMFGASTLFVSGESANAISLPLYFALSILVLGCTLLFCAATDQKNLRFYTSKKVLVGSAALTALGTLALFGAFLDGGLGIAFSVISGILTGVGSALLLLFWGVAFSRHSTATILTNTALSVVIAVCLYTILLHAVPAPFAGLIAVIIPLLELPLLWNLTPESYAVRKATPIFNPLPIRKRTFAVRMGIPVVLFGFALGILRTISIQDILPASDLVVQLLIPFAGGGATIVLMAATFAIDKQSHWDFLFRPLIPLITVALLFLPSLMLGTAPAIASLILIVGYMCFEALMWVFFGELAQQFRLSPIFVFGLGRGCLALGSLVGTVLIRNQNMLFASTPIGEMEGIILIILAMVVAYSLLPRVRDVRRLVNNEGSEGLIDDKPPIDDMDTNARMAAAAAAEAVASMEQEGEGAQEGEAPVKNGRFRNQCEVIADRYLLSSRETEVLLLLAKGHNAAFIKDKLCISQSTAKTHISHIYRKLNIHNQQELLAMVDQEKDDMPLR